MDAIRVAMRNDRFIMEHGRADDEGSRSRTDLCTLRKYLRRADGPCLMSEGRSRMSLVDFAVDTAGKAPGEALRAYLYRVLEEHDIRVPEGPTG
ncbi:MAG: hypothetical protein NTW87_19705 [Planctomycetota bacterium]|nr:hypothetical protein [Planctomycetota bacterium]